LGRMRAGGVAGVCVCVCVCVCGDGDGRGGGTAVLRWSALTAKPVLEVSASDPSRNTPSSLRRSVVAAL